MAVLNSRMIVDALVAEARRLAAFAYRGRGYLVRRRRLEQLAGFGEHPQLEGFVDHDFWQRTANAGGQARLFRQVGTRRWERQPRCSVADVDPSAVRGLLAKRAPAVAPHGVQPPR